MTEQEEMDVELRATIKAKEGLEVKLKLAIEALQMARTCIRETTNRGSEEDLCIDAIDSTLKLIKAL